MPRLKVACVQVDPTHGDPAGNMRAADAILARLSPDDALDVLLLPEMAHSGYCFDDHEDVRRVLETDDGPTVRWCAAHARRLRCTLLCGYPRIVTSASGESSSETETAFNALVAVGPDGVVLANYHKTFLYVIDKTWATEGDGFTTITLPLRGASTSAPTTTRFARRWASAWISTRASSRRRGTRTSWRARASTPNPPCYSSRRRGRTTTRTMIRRRSRRWTRRR